MNKDQQIKYAGVRIVVFIIGFVLLLNCNIKNPADDFKIIINSEPIETIISGIIKNATTGNPLNDQKVVMHIEGQNKDDIVDLTSNPKTTFSTRSGFVNFALTEAITPSENTPVRVVLVAEADGFLPTSIPLNIYNAGSAVFTVNMIELNNPPEGVAVLRETGQTDNSGAVTENDIHTVATEPGAGAYAGIYLPVGTILLDGNGQPLTGNIETMVVYHTNRTEASLNSFPGGFSVTINNNGVREDAAFITGGFASIKIKDAAGRVAKQIISSSNHLQKKGGSVTSEQSIADLPIVTIQIPAGTINPETGAPVQAGDSIGVWSYEDDSGEWNTEFNAVIDGPDENGNYTVSFQVSHLSYWNLDWKWNACSTGITILITGKEAGYPILYKLKASNNQSFYSERMSSDNSITFVRVPRNLPATLEAYDHMINMTMVGHIEINDLCASGNLTMNLDLSGIDPVTIYVQATGYCPCNPDIRVRPSGFPIWYRVSSAGVASWSYAGEVNNGEIAIPGLIADLTYIFGTYYEGEWYTLAVEVHEDYSVYAPGLSSDKIKEVTINGNNISYLVELPENVCAELCSN